MESTINLNEIRDLFLKLDINLKDSFSKELNDLLSRYKTSSGNNSLHEINEDEITMQLLKDCYGALECWDDDFVKEIEFSQSFKSRDERLMKLWEGYE